MGDGIEWLEGREKEGSELEAEGEEVGAGGFDEGELVHGYAVAEVDGEEVEEVETYATGEGVLAHNAKLFLKEGELHERSGIETGGKEGDGLPAETEVEGDIEETVLADVEGVGEAAEEVGLESGLLPVGGDAVVDLGLDVERAEYGLAVGEAEGGVAEEGDAALVEIGGEGAEVVAGGGVVVEFEIEGRFLLAERQEGRGFGTGEGRGTESQQEGKQGDAVCALHSVLFYVRQGQGGCRMGFLAFFN